MARTNAQKRQAALASGRARQERRRDKLAALGRPLTAKVDSALVEAVSFVLAASLLEEGLSGTPAGNEASAAVRIPVKKLFSVAADILERRQGYDRAQSRIAIKKRLGLRDEHRDPSYIPSLHPNPDLQAARAEIRG